MLIIIVVLVYLQGEGAQTLRKGTCANHIRDISKILTGAHLTLNARTEDDIDSDRILEKLNSIRFAVKETRPRIDEGKNNYMHNPIHSKFRLKNWFKKKIVFFSSFFLNLCIIYVLKFDFLFVLHSIEVVNVLWARFD